MHLHPHECANLALLGKYHNHICIHLLILMFDVLFSFPLLLGVFSLFFGDDKEGKELIIFDNADGER